jgi:indolepyruvate ferredoxin oxidoreductase beta subunit
MELAEGLKSLEFVKPGGTVFLNKKKVYPMDMMTHPEKYPREKEIEELFKKAKSKIIWIEAEKIAAGIGLPVVENMVLLGALSFVSSFDKEFMLEVLKKSIPREIEKNIAAFNEGYKVAEGM